MASVYIHIPFCKQACVYCNFHFSTQLSKKEVMLKAIQKEIKLRAPTFRHSINAIYIGGGTPSLLEADEVKMLLDTTYSHYNVNPKPEITLEANPDDLTKAKIKALSKTPINRLSIGVQSFFDTHLKSMGRTHTQAQAMQVLQEVQPRFDNVSADLIYGIPTQTSAQWETNLQTLEALQLPHFSAYALTVEPKTALWHQIANKKYPAVDDAQAANDYKMLLAFSTEKGYENYEFSNFGKPNYFSINNTNYWFGKPYIGIGPSAHSFQKNTRSWNIANNTKYINTLANNTVPQTQEHLSPYEQFNEYIMMRLRTQVGISLTEVNDQFGAPFLVHLQKEMQAFIKENTLKVIENRVVVTPKGKFFTDGISSALFWVEY